MTPYYKELEREIHQTLFSNLIRGEWFALGEEKINELKLKLSTLDKENFHVVDYSDFPRF